MALEAIRVLECSTQLEYEETKEILKTSFVGDRRKLQAYMDQTGALYSLLMKCPDSDSRVKSYSPWLREQARAVWC